MRVELAALWTRSLCVLSSLRSGLGRCVELAARWTWSLHVLSALDSVAAAARVEFTCVLGRDRARCALGLVAACVELAARVELDARWTWSLAPLWIRSLRLRVLSSPVYVAVELAALWTCLLRVLSSLRSGHGRYVCHPVDFVSAGVGGVTRTGRLDRDRARCALDPVAVRVGLAAPWTRWPCALSLLRSGRRWAC